MIGERRERAVLGVCRNSQQARDCFGGGVFRRGRGAIARGCDDNGSATGKSEAAVIIEVRKRMGCTIAVLSVVIAYELSRRAGLRLEQNRVAAELAAQRAKQQPKEVAA